MHYRHTYHTYKHAYQNKLKQYISEEIVMHNLYNLSLSPIFEL